jgi:hypothetical protein
LKPLITIFFAGPSDFLTAYPDDELGRRDCAFDGNEDDEQFDTSIADDGIPCTDDLPLKSETE